MGYSPWDHKESNTTERLTLFTFTWSLKRSEPGAAASVVLRTFSQINLLGKQSTATGGLYWEELPMEATQPITDS